MEFYLVLPSNACQSIHPDNKANKFYVSLNEAINLHGSGWMVALTEIHFNNRILTLTTNHGVEYKQFVDETQYEMDFYLKWRGYFESTWPGNSPIPQNKPPDRYILSAFHLGLNNVISFHNPHQRFKVTFESMDSANKLGFTESEVSSDYDPNTNAHVIIAKQAHGMRHDEKYKTLVKLTYYYPPHAESKQYFFPDNISCIHNNQLLNYIKEKLSFLFDNVEYKRDRIIMKVNSNDITEVKFLNGLNIILGIYDEVHQAETIEGYLPLTLDGGINKMFVFGNMCKPIHVGDARVRLLKLVSAQSGKQGYQNITFNNPMYVPVCEQSINSVEITICTDSGDLLPFLPGSVTTVTLHFKKI